MSDRRVSIRVQRTANVLTIVLALCWPGCTGGNAAVLLANPDAAELRTRALAQLVEAARSEDPDVRCNAIEALVRVEPQAAAQACRAALGSESPLVRYAGFVAVGETRDTQSAAALPAGVRDDSPFVRLAAAFAGARLGRSGYVRVLMDTLNGDGPENLRADAAGLVGRLADKRAIPWLEAAAKTASNERARSVQLAIQGALARLGKPAAVQELIRYTQGDVAARAEALLLLADIAPPDAYDALRFQLLRAGDEYVETRLIAARALGKLGYRDGYTLAMQHVTFTDPQLRPSPESPSRTFPVRSMAIHALGEIRDTRALPTLRDIAASGGDARLQVAASYAICAITGGAK